MIISVDTDADKIVVINGLAFIFSGSGYTGDLWRKWLVGDQKGLPPFPPDKNGKPYAVFCIVNLKEKKIELLFGNDDAWILEESGKVLFAGTGRNHARENWALTRDAIESINAAKFFDGKTGGMTKYFDLNTGKNNLSGKVYPSYEMKRLARQSGVVMFDSSGADAVTICEGMPNYARVSSLLTDYEREAQMEEDAIAHGVLCRTPTQWREPYTSYVTYVLSRLFPNRFK